MVLLRAPALFAHASDSLHTPPRIAPQVLGFQARRQGGQSVQLKWGVSEQQEGLRFQVEKKLGAGDFERVAEVPGERDSTGMFVYVDQSPMAHQVFYRIKVLPREGHFRYSGITQVDFDEVARLHRMIPQFDGRLIHIRLEEPGLHQVMLTDQAGAVILFSQMKTQQVSTLLSVDQLPVGTYWLKVVSPSGKSSMHKIVRK